MDATASRIFGCLLDATRWKAGRRGEYTGNRKPLQPLLERRWWREEGGRGWNRRGGKRNEGKWREYRAERKRGRSKKKRRKKKKKKKADSNLYQPLGETPAGGKISSAFEKRGSGEVYWVLEHVVSRGHAGKCEWNLFFTHPSHPAPPRTAYNQAAGEGRGGESVFTTRCRGKRETDRGSRWLRDFKKMLGTRFAIPKI